MINACLKQASYGLHNKILKSFQCMGLAWEMKYLVEQIIDIHYNWVCKKPTISSTSCVSHGKANVGSASLGTWEHRYYKPRSYLIDHYCLSDRLISCFSCGSWSSLNTRVMLSWREIRTGAAHQRGHSSSLRSSSQSWAWEHCWSLSTSEVGQL